MRHIRTLSLSVALLLASAAAHAQQEQPREATPKQTDSHSDGTTPGSMGSTGWTGGTGGSHIGTSNSHTTGSGGIAEAGRTADSSAADQPLMATGEDLNGPPVRFAPDNTPE